MSIVTNSLPSTDNLYAFSGYRKQRGEILAAGIEVYEYRPDPEIQKQLFERYAKVKEHPPVFALHAKSLVVDGETAFIGSFNLDPRSSHLNTEVGVLVKNRRVAEPLERAIRTDMAPENSWNARRGDADRFAPIGKRIQVWLMELLPLSPIL